MRPLLRAVALLAMVLLAAQAVAGVTLAHTDGSVSQAWCGSEAGDAYAHPFVHPYGLHAHLDLSARAGGAAACASVAVDAADFGVTLPPPP
jgi:hypothetical protein